MSGFVYIWRDRKHNRYYIGSHWGSPDDGYICSSSWMKQAYKHRPYDFKRRILTRIETIRKDLLEIEYKWLSLIKKEELGKRYYNVKIITSFNEWSPQQRKSMSEIKKQQYIDNPRLRIKLKAKERVTSETRIKMSKAKLGHIPWNKGSNGSYTHKPLSEETKAKISQAHMGKKFSEESRKKMSESMKGRVNPNKGRTNWFKHTDEWKNNMSEKMKNKPGKKGKRGPQKNPGIRKPRGPYKNKQLELQEQ